MAEDEKNRQPDERLEDPAVPTASPAELEPPTGWGIVAAWFERPATLVDFGAVVLLVLAALAGYARVSPYVASTHRAPGAPRPMGTPLSPRHVAWLMGLPEQQVVPAGIEITGRPDAVFRPGDPLRLRISLRAPARVVVLEEPANGPGTQAWPGLSQAPALVAPPRAGGPAIQPLSLEAPAVEGMHRLRLVVIAADLDLAALLPTDLPNAAARLTIVDLRYQVARR